MNLTVAALVLLSAAIHPLWNALIKHGGKPEGTFFSLNLVVLLIAALHGISAGDALLPPAALLPLLAGSAAGQLVYGLALIATLRRGDLSLYYPVIRASPLFIVVVGVTVLGQHYSLNVLLGIALVILGIVILHGRLGGGAAAEGDPVTLLLALLAMSGSGVYSITDSLLVRGGMPPTAVLFWATLPGLPFFYLMHRRNRGPHPPPFFARGAVGRSLAAGALSYSSYYLILVAFRLGGEPAAVTAVRQAAIPLSVMVGGLLLRETGLTRRTVGSLVVGIGIVLIVLLH